MSDLGHHTRQEDRPDHSNYNYFNSKVSRKLSSVRNVAYPVACNVAKGKGCKVAQGRGCNIAQAQGCKVAQGWVRNIAYLPIFHSEQQTTFSRWEKAILILGKGGFSYKIASYERRYLLSEKPSQTAFRRDFQPLGPRYFNLYFSRSYRRKDDLL